MNVGEHTRKQQLLAEFKRLAARLGRVPGIREFIKESGTKKHLWDGNLWPSWRAFLVEGGFEPNELTEAFSDDEMLRRLAELARFHARFPTTRELKYARVRDPSIPGEKTYRNRFKRQSDMIARLRQWTADKPDWKDVHDALPSIAAEVREREAPGTPATTRASIARLSDRYIPPVIDALDDLAAGDPGVLAECKSLGLDPNVEYERQVSIAFHLLGLDVQKLGQGGGRVADGVARCRRGRWALVYDAKLRRGGFTLGTEDRKFREYLEQHGRELSREGFDSIYFGVVSSDFALKDLEGAVQLVHTTCAKAVSLIEARALRLLVDLHMRGAHDDAEQVQRIVGTTQIVTLAAVRKQLE